jgi:hypothetical protein
MVLPGWATHSVSVASIRATGLEMTELSSSFRSVVPILGPGHQEG